MPGCSPPRPTDFPDSKINALVENVTAIWQRTAPTRGTQLIFADLGVNPTPWGYAVYADIIAKLVQHGIPRQDIAAIGDADTDAKKQVLFEQVRQGTVRILLGSTQKMGTGTNVQKRLVALHHLDAPWKPAEVEQRDGRILRCPFTHKMARLPGYASNATLSCYASSRVDSATDESAHGGLLLPPQFTPRCRSGRRYSALLAILRGLASCAATRLTEGKRPCAWSARVTVRISSRHAWRRC